jgi:hypothetical protein
MCGIGSKTWYQWELAGRVPPATWIPWPGGGRAKVYPADQVERLRQTIGADAFPPVGFVERQEAARLCGVDLEAFRYLEKQGRFAGARLVKKPGDRARVNVYPEDEVRRVGEELRRAAEAPFPPPGFVDRYQAAAFLGVQVNALNLWLKKGRLKYAGTSIPGPNGVKCRVFAVAELEKARNEIAAQDAAADQLPEGYVDFAGAAAFFGGVHPVTLNDWQQRGRLGRGKWLNRANGKRRHVFAIADLGRVREEMAAEASRPVAPEGFIELDEAARMLGVNAMTLRQWELRGRLPEGQVAPIPGTSARTKIYSIEQIERLAQEIKDALENFPPPGWLEMNEAARRANVSVQVWKRWLQDGRVENWRWFSRPTMARCKLFSIEEIDRLVEEAGRDHLFFMESNGRGEWRAPEGYVDRDDAAKIFGVATGTFVHWQTDGRINCGRWARIPVEEASVRGCGGRRVYPVDELRRLAEEFSKVGKPYPDPKDPGIVRVPIMSWSKTRFEAIIDAADLPLIEQKRWNWMPRSDGEDAVVVVSAPAGEQIPMRQIILGLRRKGRQSKISHRNGNPLDCRRENLVVRNPSEVLGHARKRKTNGGKPCTSRFKGVCWIEKSGKWLAQIQKEGDHKRLGYFDDELAAAEAYDEAAREWFGEHARPNFPDGIDKWLEQEAAGQQREAA